MKMQFFQGPSCNVATYAMLSRIKSVWVQKLQNYNETTKECRHTKETLQN